MVFIFAEVNADRITWIYNSSNGSQKQNSLDTYSIGKYISTKAVGSKLAWISQTSTSIQKVRLVLKVGVTE